MGWLRIGTGCLLFALAGCAAQALTLRPEPRSFTQSDYEMVYRRWTKDADDFAFSRLHTVLHATATFESWEFRWAYVVRYAHDHALDTESRTEMLRASLDDARSTHRFFVTMAGEDFRESDITSRRSAWRVLLVDEDGRQSVPVDIERIRRPGASERTYFPSISVFRQTFRVAFPGTHDDGQPTIRPDARFILLRFTGPLGTIDLRWDFRAGGASAED